jgi:PAS domain S-box-containing protein
MVSDELAVSEVLESLPCGIVVVDHEDRVAYLNQRAATILLVHKDKWIGLPVQDFARHLERELGCAGLWSHMRRGAGEPEVCSSRELIVRQASEVKQLRMDSAPLYDQMGIVSGRVFAYHDITREKGIDQRKTEFIGIASHELRTPMTSIKGAIDLVLSGFAGDINTEARELLAIAQDNCQRLVRLVNEILDLSKIEAGQIELNLQAIDPLVPVENAIRALRSFASQHAVKVEIQSNGPRASVRVDKDRVEQIVTNLLSNAIKFSPSGGTVLVRVSAQGDWFECSVIDHGCGISKEDIPKLFNKFQQLGNTGKKGGTGLGLAIAKELVKQHNGNMWAESKVGEGSTFTFNLPVDPDAV